MRAEEANLTIGDLPWLVSGLLLRADHPVLEVGEALEIWPRYLREKLGSGLVLTFAMTPTRAPGSRSQRWGTLTLTGGLRERRLPFARSAALAGPVRVDEHGVIWADSLDARVQLFPVDPQMPALARCLDPSKDAALRGALERAGRLQLGDDSLTLLSADAQAVRYKPGNRCTIRYRLELRGPNGPSPHPVTVFGKVYADLEDAETVVRTLGRLHAATLTEGSRAVVPEPLAWDRTLGLVLFEGLEPEPGPHPLQPSAAQAETVAGLQKAAEAVARLHACASEPLSGGLVESREAKRAAQRTALLAAACPEHAARLQQVGERVTRRLAAAPPMLRPVHGAMKPSHVLYPDGTAVLIDCDSTRIDDPAMDVGGFLAYLRPSGIWFGRRSSETWFKAASRRFLEAYRGSMSRLGVGEKEIDSCLKRARAYECSRLLKIAARRPQRLNSILPAELGAMCDAMERILGEDNR